MAKLRNCADYYGWAETDRLCHLKASLEGNAAAILWELSPECTEAELLKLLHNRYGNKEQIERFRFELKTRRRRKGESLQSLHQDICRLLALSYPGETSALSKIVARDAFLDALDSPELRVHILEKDASSLDDAYSIAMRHEAYRATSNASETTQADDGGRRRVRAVNSATELSEDDRSWKRRMESTVADLQNGIQLLLQRQPMTVQVGPGAVVPPAQQSPGQQTSTAPSATIAGPHTGSRQRPRGSGPCYKCGGEGHIARWCKQPSTTVPTSQPEGRASSFKVAPSGNESEVYLDVQLGCKGSRNLRISAVLDSGCSLSIMPAKFCHERLQSSNVKLYAANESLIPVLGQTRVYFTVEGLQLYADVLVSEVVDEFLLGFDWLCANECVWHFATGTINVQGRELKLNRRQSSVNVRRVYIADSTLVEKRSVAHVPVTVAFTSLHTAPSNWLLEPRVANNRLLVARALLSDAQDGVIRVYNPSNEDVLVKSGICVGNAQAAQFGCEKCGPICMCRPSSLMNEPQIKSMHNGAQAPVASETSGGRVSSPVIVNVRAVRPVSHSAGSATVNGPPDDSLREGINSTSVLSDEEVIKPALDSLPGEITAVHREQVRELLLRNADLFAKSEYDVGKTNLLQHRLELVDPNAAPVRQPLRRHPIAYLDLIDQQVDQLLHAGLITPCSGEWSSNVVLVRKRGSGPDVPPKMRLTVDLREVNFRLRRLQFPMPSIDSIFDNLQGHRYYTTLDFCNAYLSIPLHPETNDVTGFVTRRGHFKFLRLSAGVCNGAAAFNELVQLMFGKLLWSEVLCFLDDACLPSATVEQGIDLLGRVLERIRIGGLKLKANKCKLLQTEAKILGLVVGQGTVREDPSRAEVVQAWPFPRTVRELRSFIGFANYGRNFYENFSEIIEPLTACMRKGAKLECNEKTLSAFQRVKDLMSNPPVLTLFRGDAAHVVECDSSDIASGACLKQIESDGQERVVAYASKMLSDPQRRWCTTRKELLAVIFALTRWRHYLIGRKVIVRTDHNCLQYLLKGKSLTDQFARYIDFLADFDLQIEYLPGKSNRIADFLSRPCELDPANSCKQCRARQVHTGGAAAADAIGDKGEVRRRGDARESVPPLQVQRQVSMVEHTLAPSCEPVPAHATAGRQCAEMLPSLSEGAPFASATEPPTTVEINLDDDLIAVNSVPSTDEVPAGERSMNESLVVGATKAPAEVAFTTLSDVRRVATRAQSRAADEGDAGNRLPDVSEGEGDNDSIDQPSNNAAIQGRRRGQQLGEILRAIAPSAANDLRANKFWSREYVVEQQTKDAVLSEVKRWLESKQRPSWSELKPSSELRCYFQQVESLSMVDGIMYRTFLDSRGAVKYTQILLPESMRPTFCELIHAVALGHAKTLRKNEAQAQIHAFWPTWRRDLRVYVAACRRCAEYHRGAAPKQGALRSSCDKLCAPSQLVSIDLTGPHVLSDGYKYCLSVQDCFTKFLFLAPLRDKTAQHVARALLQFFLKHGFYAYVKSDNGLEFINGLQEELDKLTDTVRLKTCPYTPRQNPVERSHRTVNSIIGKLVDKHSQWSRYLDFVAFAFNSTVQKSTGFTPNFLQFGRELGNSVSVILANPVSQYETHGEFASELIDRMRQAYELASETLQAETLSAKRHYDQRARFKEFQPGDVVLIFCPRRRQNQNIKWQRMYSVEAVILSRINDVTYIVQERKSRQRKIVHVDKLKLVQKAAGSGSFNANGTSR